MDVSKYHTRHPPREHEEAVRMLLEGLERQAPQGDLSNKLAGQSAREREHEREHEQELERARAGDLGRERKSKPRKTQDAEISGKLASGRRLPAQEGTGTGSSVDSGSMARGEPASDYEENFGGQEQEQEQERHYEHHRKQQQHHHHHKHNQHHSSHRRGRHDREFGRAAPLDERRLDFNSEESSSREFSIQVTPQIKRNHLASRRQPDAPAHVYLDSAPEVTGARPGVPRTQSRGTSTASDSVSTSGASSASQRAISGQGDNDDHGDGDDDQLNGDYEAIPSRTIAIQCDLKLSSVKRDGQLESCASSADLASVAQASSISSTRYGFYKLSPETLEQRRQLARSVSSRNIAHGALGGAPETRSSANERLSSDEEERDADGPTRGARTRRDSLPRRPRTALSYVSTSRLRDAQHSGELTPDKSLGDQELEGDEHGHAALCPTRHMAAGSRALSQQALSSAGLPSRRREQPAAAAGAEPADGHKWRARPVDHGSQSNSDSGAESGALRSRLARREEILLATKRARPALGGASPQVRRSNTMRNGPLLRRYATLTAPPAAGFELARAANAARETPNGVSGRHTEERARRVASSERESERAHRDRLSNYSSNTTDEEIQLARAVAAEARRQRAATLGGHERAAARFGPMSRRHQAPPAGPQPPSGADFATSDQERDSQQQQQQQDDHHHSQLDQRPARHGRPQRGSTLTRADRPARPGPLVNGGGGYLATSGRRAHIGRSTSMRQGRCALPADELDTLAQPVYTTPHQQMHLHHNAAGFHPDQRAYYESEASACERVAGDAAARTRRPGSEDSEAPGARTWANPGSARRGLRSGQSHHRSIYDLNDGATGRPLAGHQYASGGPLTRDSARSHSMREVNELGAPVAGLATGAREPLASYAPMGAQRPKRFERIYHAGQELDSEEAARQPDEEAPSEEFSVCSTSSISGPSQQQQQHHESLTRAQAHHQPLDFDSQQRLNEIGLPEPDLLNHHNHSHHHHQHHQQLLAPLAMGTKRSSASHLGLSANLAGAASRYATTGRAPAQAARPAGQALITGRAMSQQSLTRPTMPLSRRLRRSGGGGVSAGSGSDVGGSSISLVSRLRDGSRYENAHTRTPVVMLIPQAPAESARLTASELARSSESSSRRASARPGRTLGKGSGSRVSSQDRAHRRSSASRNNSDSESSSSMLRTLVKPRINRVGSTNRSARRRLGAQGPAGGRDDSDLEENMDGVGQLATEIDSYKFRRRYSVPKDAKINWFSKLKQRVTSKG